MPENNCAGDVMVSLLGTRVFVDGFAGVGVR